MKNNYIINKDFYIKDDLTSFLLYYDYLSQGLSMLNRYSDSTIIRKFAHNLLRGFIILIYFSKAHKALYKDISLEDDALVIIKRKGKWGNTLRLIKSNGKLKMIKKSSDNDAYLRENNYYNTYQNNETKLKLINHSFLQDNTIEMDFVKSKTLQRLVNEGSINFQQSIEHFKKIRAEVNNLYKNNPSLVHGDLWLTNMFIKNDEYHIIDYTDAHEETIEYELYVFLLSLLSSFRDFGTNREDADFYLKKRKIISELLNISIGKVTEIEERYKLFRTLKMSDK